MPLGETPEAQVMLDKDSIETTGDEVMARLKFLYHKVQPAQTKETPGSLFTCRPE